MMEQLWPYVAEFATQVIKEEVEPEIKAQMPGPFKSFKFVRIDMGDIPCRVGGIKVRRLIFSFDPDFQK